MKLSRYAILLLIGLVTFALIGLIHEQSCWMESALELKKQNLNSEIKAVLLNARHHIQEEPIYLAAKVGHYDCDTPVAFDSADLSKTIELILNEEFERADLHLSYRFGLYNQEGIGLLGNVPPKELRSCNNVGSHFFCQGNQHNHLYLALPEQEADHWQAYAATIAPSIGLMLIIVAAFSFTIFTIFHQKRLSAIKDDFINNMTHELKTPIFSISMASRVISQAPEVKECGRLQKCATVIDEETNRLRTQVDKVLQMALLDSGNLKLERVSLNVHELIQKIAHSFEMAIQEKGGNVQLHLNAKNNIIWADKTHLVNVIYNLLDNALKYTEKAPEIIICTKDSDNQTISLSIRDNGIGIARDQHEQIFHRFYRIKKGDLYTVKGFGLGLCYVKSIIELHQGKVGLNSQVDKGSEFTIVLPQN